MSIETPADLAALRRVGHITRLALDALERNVRAGVTTAELDAVAAALFDKHGARSAPAMVYKFPGHVLISINDEVVHGVPGPRMLERGDLVKLDVTVEKDGYIADAARSVIVGPATDTATRLVACVRAAFRAGLSVARAGTRVNEIGRAVQNEVKRHGFAVVHGLSGHGVGRTIHEEPTVPNTYDRWQKDVPHGRPRDHHRADDYGWLVASRRICRRLDNPNVRRESFRAPRAHPCDHTAGAADPDRRVTRRHAMLLP